MALDFRNIYGSGLQNLLTWRNRYSTSEYPEKVVTNIFYRKFTMEAMWHTIITSFDDEKWSDWNVGFAQLRQEYSQTATLKILPKLDGLATDTSISVGSTGYRYFKDLVETARMGHQKNLEEIEFRYLYYLLTDESILIWSALGGTGKSMVDAVALLTGVVFEFNSELNYLTIEETLGHYGVSPYLNKHYKPLPPNV